MERDGEVVYQGEIIDTACQYAENLFLSTKKGLVYAIDGRMRKIIWSFQADENLASPPYLGEESLYVYDNHANIYCLDKDGKLLWKKKIEDKITSGIREYQSRLFVGTEKGIFFVLDGKDGKNLWSFQAKEAIRSTPIVAAGMIIFGCDDHNLYFLDLEGNLIDKIETGDAIRVAALADGNELYFGSDDTHCYSLDLKRKTINWKTKIGCRIYTSPIADNKRVLFLCWNGILYCLNKKTGTVLWWKSVPARTSYSLALIEEKVVVTSLSNFLVSFDVKTGEKAGEFDATQVIQSNPLWLKPYLLINLYDYNKEEGTLVFLKKVLQVNLTSSKKSPQKTGEELVFTASGIGFFLPKYEFTLNSLYRVNLNPAFFILSLEWQEKVVQPNSEKNTWEWFPEIPGVFFVRAKVVDEKESLESEFPFLIEKEKPKVSLKASKESPQKKEEKIVFGASATGLQMPQYEFSLSRLRKMDFNSAFFLFYAEWEIKVVQPKSEKNSWEWSPERSGFYVVGIQAADEKEEVENKIPFLIREISDDEMRGMIFFLRYWINIQIEILTGF